MEGRLPLVWNRTVDRLQLTVRHPTALEDRLHSLQLLLHRPAKLHVQFETTALRPGQPLASVRVKTI